MNESNQLMGDQSQNQVASQQPAPMAPPVQQPPVTPENLVPQHRVNELISDAMQRGRDKAMKEISSTQHPSMNAEEIRKMAREEFLRSQQELEQKLREENLRKEGERVLSNVETKLQDTRNANKFPDFDEKIRSLQLDKMPALIHYVDKVDNPSEVLYDLANNRGKLSMLNGLPPHLVLDEIQKLSNSIKMNDSADANRLPNDPFNSIKPTAGVGIDKRPSDRTASEWSKHYKGKF